MEKLILYNELAPGDIVMMTAAVRDLHLAYPKRFSTDVRTSCPALWANNPHITPIRENERGVRKINCAYPLINHSNSAPFHFVHGFTQHLAETLKLEIQPTSFKGDIHLNNIERNYPSQVHENTMGAQPYWIIAAGGKWDYTIKWWETSRWQEVVDQFRGRILFVQVGESRHHHPPLKGVVDLRGKTCLRQLVRLVHHAQGVLCPVTSLMHLAAAVETKQAGLDRPCVVVAGGREPPHWETYPGHRFIHTMGALKCCSSGGCWRSRTLPLHDGDSKDLPENLCMDVVGNLPRCMDIITPEHVVSQIESYFQAGGPWRYLRPGEAERVAALVGWDRRELKYRRSRTNQHDTRWPHSTNGESPLTATNVITRLEQCLKDLPAMPKYQFRGRGIVICGGGLSYLPSAWVNVGMLRRNGCTLPVELWHFPGEVDATIYELFAKQGAKCVDCHERMEAMGHAKVTSGWEMKPLAILYSDFTEVLFLDADNMAVYDPASLFDTKDYRQTGAVFWPDYTSLAEDDPIWRICGVPYRDEPEFESGQILIDKVRHWKPLQLALWFNRQAAFFRHYFLGDKETFHFAFRYLEVSYSMPPYAIENLANKTMCQHDFLGRRVFQHRNLAKWSLHGRNDSIPDFRFESECLQLVAGLRRLWPGRIKTVPRWERISSRTRLMLAYADALQRKRWHLHLEGGETCRVMFGSDGRLHSLPQSKHFLYWDFKRAVNRPHLEISSEKGPVAELEKDPRGGWTGLFRYEGQQKRIQVLPRQRVPQSDACDPVFRALTGSVWAYRIEGQQQRTMTLNPDGTIGKGAGNLEMFWSLENTDDSRHVLRFADWDNVTAALEWDPQGCWQGGWTKWQNPKISLHRIRMEVQETEGAVRGHSHPVVRFPCQADCESPSFLTWCAKMRAQPRYHRRQWELVTTVQTVQDLIQEVSLKRLVVVNPGDDELVDSLASMAVEVVCILEDDWQNLPPTKRQNKLQSAKREFNRRGITPWQCFNQQVIVHDTGGDIPSHVIVDPAHTAVIWHSALRSKAGGLSLPIAELAGRLPSVAVAVIAIDVALETVPSELSSIEEVAPPTRETLLRWLDQEGYLDGPILPNESLNHSVSSQSPVDTYVDFPPYQGNHHLKLKTPRGVLTSALLTLRKMLPAPLPIIQAHLLPNEVVTKARQPRLGWYANSHPRRTSHDS